MPLEQSRIEAILGRFGDAEREDLDRLIPVLYERLRELAHYRLQAAPGEDSLSTTGLVHEAYLRLAGSRPVALLNRDHVLAVASRIMRNILVDHARARGALKRGGGRDAVPLREDMWVAAVDLDGVADLDEALKRLETIDARQSDIVELHYFGGLSLEETAAALSLSLATVKRDLRLARAWLAASLTGESE
jgi:RNA polymerase sigma factor (TIGR02999 family)